MTPIRVLPIGSPLTEVFQINRTARRREDQRTGIEHMRHRTPPGLLRCELAVVGYREISLDRLTGSDAYLAIFAPPSIATRTRPSCPLYPRKQTWVERSGDVRFVANADIRERQAFGGARTRHGNGPGQ